VGAIFYELLSARKPFADDTITGVVQKIRTEDPDPGPLPATPFSPGLERIVLKALRRDPRERYASAEELREELAAVVREAAPGLAASDVAETPAWEAEAVPEAPWGPEAAGLHAALDRARQRGESALALAIVRRLLDLDPEDTRARAAAGEIEAQVREAEAEQLCAIALAYASDGEVEKAVEIAEKIERLSPWSPRYLQLQVYLDEEAAARDAQGLAEAARQSLERGDLVQALAQAEEALVLAPTHHLALRVKDQAQVGTDTPQGDDELADALEAALKEESEEKAAAAAARDLGGFEGPTRLVPPPSRTADVEILTSAALDRFLQDDHQGAQRAASMALELDPRNRKARELLKVLGALG